MERNGGISRVIINRKSSTAMSRESLTISAILGNSDWDFTTWSVVTVSHIPNIFRYREDFDEYFKGNLIPIPDHPLVLKALKNSELISDVNRCVLESFVGGESQISLRVSEKIPGQGNQRSSALYLCTWYAAVSKPQRCHKISQRHHIQGG